MRIFLTLGLLLTSVNVFTQAKMVGISKVSNGEILLRWAVDDWSIYRESKESGFSIQRIVKQKTETPSDQEWNNEKVLSTVFPFSGNDSLWEKQYQADEKYLLLRKMLYPEEKESIEKEQSLYGMFLVSIDQDSAFAKNTGLFFRDRVEENNVTVFYRISTNGRQKISVVLKVDPTHHTEYKKIDEFEVSKRGTTVELKWKHGNLIRDYSSYILERSEDSVRFFPLTEQNFIPFATQFEKDKIYSYFTDSSVQLNQKYYYRIIPVDHFGVRNKSTKVKSIYVAAPITSEIGIDSLYESEPGKIKLSWNTNHPDEAIDRFVIYHATQISGEYKKIADLEKNQFFYQYNIYHRVNYFKVVAKNNYGDSISSWPEMILLPDRILPGKVEELTGKMDTNGIVYLKWKGNTDPDLMGYRVFKSNARFEEFVEVTKEINRTNKFLDSIYLETLTEEIFYVLTAVDSNYNNSIISDTLRLIKPDLIAPSVAPIVKFTSDKKGNGIYWEKSSSRDVELTQLLASADGIIFHPVFEARASAVSPFYLDTNVRLNEGVYYKTRVIDDAGNFTDCQPVYILGQRLLNVERFHCTTKVDRAKKEIIFQWNSPFEKVYSYSIYKAKKGDPLRNFKTIFSDECTFTDRELYISNTYVYTIKATLESGREVVIIENREVEY